jgi:E3 ubiquitin-protein ligase TRIP12
MKIIHISFSLKQSSTSPTSKSTSPPPNQQFFFSPTGLFPAPLQSNCKQSSKQHAHLTKLKSRFRFLGKFMAKALMDSRVLDIQLSYTFYKWLLEPNSLTDEDVKYVDSGLYQSLESLRGYLRRRRQLLAKAYELATEGDLRNAEASEAMRSVEAELKTLEETVECIELDFTLPGYGFELKKGGKDVNVNLENLEEYLKVSLIGVYLLRWNDASKLNY